MSADDDEADAEWREAAQPTPEELRERDRKAQAAQKAQRTSRSEPSGTQINDWSVFNEELARHKGEGKARAAFNAERARHTIEKAQGMPVEDALTILGDAYANARREGNSGYERRNPPLDWAEVFNRDTEMNWLVEDMWPVGGQLHLHAPQKVGKSILNLWMGSNLAIGKDPFTGSKIEPVTSSYFDREMRVDDIRDRLQDMGFTPDVLDNLKYHPFPVMQPLDTPQGGYDLLKEIQLDGSSVAFIDNLVRWVEGDENNADTYIKLYNCTGLLLNQESISTLRSDHEGYGGQHSRGSSAKGDDVDIVWQLKRTDDGLLLVRKAARVQGIPDKIDLRQSTEPLKFSRTASSWPEGTGPKAQQLDEIGAPVDISRTVARKLLEAAGLTGGPNTVLAAAVRFRKQKRLL